MNALAVQNQHHKCDLGNKNDSVIDHGQENNCRQYLTVIIIITHYTEIIIYMHVCVDYNLHFKSYTKAT